MNTFRKVLAAAAAAGKAGLSNRFMSLKAYQTPAHCSVIYTTVKKDFTAFNLSHSHSDHNLQ